MAKFLFFTLFLPLNLLYSQTDTDSIDLDKSKICFRDTIFNFAFDSINHNLGKIDIQNKTITKYFKYIGKDKISIVKAWTGDPHFICSYPKGSLEYDKIYSFSICFSHNGKLGNLNKMMGFVLSDGNRIEIKLTGHYNLKQED